MRCAQPIGLQRFFGATLCGSCSKIEKAEREAARAEYESLLAVAGDPRTDPVRIGSSLPAIAARAGLKPQDVRNLNWNALLQAFERALSDEVVTRDEEDVTSEKP